MIGAKRKRNRGGHSLGLGTIGDEGGTGFHCGVAVPSRSGCTELRRFCGFLGVMGIFGAAAFTARGQRTSVHREGRTESSGNWALIS